MELEVQGPLWGPTSRYFLNICLPILQVTSLHFTEKPHQVVFGTGMDEALEWTKSSSLNDWLKVSLSFLTLASKYDKWGCWSFEGGLRRRPQLGSLPPHPLIPPPPACKVKTNFVCKELLLTHQTIQSRRSTNLFSSPCSTYFV